jgi:nitroreductase
LLAAATLTPTSFNLQHWRFVVIDDREKLESVVAGSGWRRGEPLPAALILVCARISVWQEVLCYNKHLDAAATQRIARNCHQIYDRNVRVQRDEAFRSGGLVTTTLMELLRENGLSSGYLPDACAEASSAMAYLESDSVMVSAIAIESPATSLPREDGTSHEGIALLRDEFPDTLRCSTSDALEARRAIKHFDKSYRLSAQMFARIISSIPGLPSGVNVGAMRIVDVVDEGARDSIARVGFAQPQYTEAAKVLVLCYDIGADPATLPLSEYNRRRDAAMVCAGLAAQRMMLTAASLGVDSCPMIGFDYEAVGRLLHKPESCLVLMVVALGKRRQDPAPRARRLSVQDVVMYNTVQKE